MVESRGLDQIDQDLVAGIERQHAAARMPFVMLQGGKAERLDAGGLPCPRDPCRRAAAR